MAERATSVNTFAFIQHPRITSITRKSIQDFLAQRDANCFDGIFLRSLVRARVFGKEIQDIASLTDDLIKTKLTALSSRGKAVSYEEVMADVKRSISLNASEPDARLRILILQTAYLDLCERRGWNFVDEAPKAAVRHILSVIQPPELKSRFLQEEAEICERFHPLRKYRSNTNPKTTPKKSVCHLVSIQSARRITLTRIVILPLLKKGKNFLMPSINKNLTRNLRLILDQKMRKQDLPENKLHLKSLNLQQPNLPWSWLNYRDTNLHVVFDGHSFKSPGLVKLCPTIKTIAGPCRLRNIKPYIMLCDDTSIMPGADCTGEIILGNPFLVYSSLDVTDFLADNMDHLSTLDYGALNTIKHPYVTCSPMKIFL